MNINRLSDLQKNMMQVLAQSPYLSNETGQKVVNNAKLIEEALGKANTEINSIKGIEKYNKELEGCWKLFLETNKIVNRKLTETETKQWNDRLTEFNKRERYATILEKIKEVENRDIDIKLDIITDISGIPPMFILNNPELF